MELPNDLRCELFEHLPVDDGLRLWQVLKIDLPKSGIKRVSSYVSDLEKKKQRHKEQISELQNKNRRLIQIMANMIYEEKYSNNISMVPEDDIVLGLLEPRRGMKRQRDY